MEKNTIGNEPYIKKATVLGGFFVLYIKCVEEMDRRLVMIDLDKRYCRQKYIEIKIRGKI